MSKQGMNPLLNPYFFYKILINTSANAKAKAKAANLFFIFLKSS